MSIFNRNKSKNDSYSTNYSTPEYNPSYKNYEDEDEDYDYGIKFKKELSNGALVFLIVDDDYDHVGGYVVVSPSGILQLLTMSCMILMRKTVHMLKFLQKISLTPPECNFSKNGIPELGYHFCFFNTFILQVPKYSP